MSEVVKMEIIEEKVMREIIEIFYTMYLLRGSSRKLNDVLTAVIRDSEGFNKAWNSMDKKTDEEKEIIANDLINFNKILLDLNKDMKHKTEKIMRNIEDMHIFIDQSNNNSSDKKKG